MWVLYHIRIHTQLCTSSPTHLTHHALIPTALHVHLQHTYVHGWGYSSITCRSTPFHQLHSLQRRTHTAVQTTYECTKTPHSIYIHTIRLYSTHCTVNVHGHNTQLQNLEDGVHHNTMQNICSLNCTRVYVCNSNACTSIHTFTNTTHTFLLHLVLPL